MRNVLLCLLVFELEGFLGEMNDKNKCDAEGVSCHELLRTLEPIEGIPLNRDTLKVYLAINNKDSPVMGVEYSRVSKNKEGKVFNRTIVEHGIGRILYTPRGHYCRCEETLTKPLKDSGSRSNSYSLPS